MLGVSALLVTSCALALVAHGAAQDVFSEEVFVSWLTPRHMMVHLRFDQATTASRHHTSFPHAIQHLAATLPLHSVGLTLTSGRWHYGDWGTPLVPANPVGAVLDAAFHAGLQQAELDAHWSALVHALSGLSCASLSLLREPSSVAGGRLRLQDLQHGSVASGTSPHGAAANASTVSSHRLHAMLPHEALCTENLTPWLRLLPCRDQAGLASLLRHRPTVFGAEYVSLSLLVDRGASREALLGVRLVLSCTLVLRVPPPQSKEPAPQPRDLEQLLGSQVEHFCPAALRSQVYVAVRPAAAAATAAERAPQGGSCASRSGGDGGASTASCGVDSGPGGPAQGADQRGALLAPWCRAASSEPADPVPAACSAVPYLRAYDTLDLLDVRGWGLHLALPPPLQQQQQQGAEVRSGAGPGSSPTGAAGAAAEYGVLASPGPADLTTERYVTGAGLLRGGMVLTVRRSQQLRARLLELHGRTCGRPRRKEQEQEGQEEEGAGAAGGSGAGAPGGSAVCLAHVVCVDQVFPWYVRPWLHSLQLLYDGQVVPLLPHLVARRVQPALQRSSPGLLDLCLHVPPAVAELQLRLAFSKAFLTAFEYPPDAHRGFDVPAAAVSYVDPLFAPAVEWRVVAGGGGGEAAGAGAEAGSGDEQEEVVGSPLLAALPVGAVRQVFTSGLLIPLAAPDFSMPYNVICLSSTLLAIYFGTVFNALTRRAGGPNEDDDSQDGTGKRRRRRRKALQLAVFVLVFGALALYLDADLREQAEGWLGALGVPVGTKQPVCSGSQPC